MLEQVPSTFPSMFWGYAVIWGILAVYILSLGRRLSRAEKALQNRSGDSRNK